MIQTNKQRIKDIIHLIPSIQTVGVIVKDSVMHESLITGIIILHLVVNLIAQILRVIGESLIIPKNLTGIIIHHLEVNLIQVTGVAGKNLAIPESRIGIINNLLEVNLIPVA